MAPQQASLTHKNSRWAGITLHMIGLSVRTLHLTSNDQRAWWDVEPPTPDTQRRDGRADGLAEEDDVHGTITDALTRHGAMVDDLTCEHCGTTQYRNTQRTDAYRAIYLDLDDFTSPSGWHGDADMSDWEDTEERWECQSCGTPAIHRVEAVLDDVYFAVA